MQLEVGKKYVTRKGDIVTIESDTKDQPRPFFGSIKTVLGEPVRIAFFTSNGDYLLSRESEFDILDEYSTEH